MKRSLDDNARPGSGSIGRSHEVIEALPVRADPGDVELLRRCFVIEASYRPSASRTPAPSPYLEAAMALVQELGIAVPRTHDLVDLLALLPPCGAMWPDRALERGRS